MAHILLDDVSLEFPVFGEEDFSFRKKLINLFQTTNRNDTRRKPIVALKNISLDIRDGDRIGLIGLNGAGKTTLLKLIGRIYSATSGCIEIIGSCSTLFDLSLGMDDEASGYENIYIGGCMLGLGRKEIRERLAEIEEFTELGSALRRPLRTFSTGMRVRLAFAIATGFSSDIMLIDEIIGVGDVKFLSKASSRIRRRIDQSKIVVLASHAEFVLKDFCDYGVLLNEGKMLEFGPIEEVLKKYNEGIVHRLV